jgi:hypothetical protein
VQHPNTAEDDLALGVFLNAFLAFAGSFDFADRFAAFFALDDRFDFDAFLVFAVRFLDVLAITPSIVGLANLNCGVAKSN